MSQTARINNWDLVDLSAPGIVGEYLKDKPRDVLYRLAGNELLWDQRIAVVSTYALIKNDDFIDILALSEHFLCTRYDLMQKAVGWMLREMGKRNKTYWCSSLKSIVSDASHNVALCDREISGRRTERVHEAVIGRHTMLATLSSFAPQKSG